MPTTTDAQARADTYRAYLVKTHHTLSATEQATRLGLRPGYVRRLRSTLVKAGALDQTKRRQTPEWSAADWRGFVAALRDGATIGDAAATVKRTRAGALGQVARRGTAIAALRRGHVWTRHEIRRLFGIGWEVIGNWIARGWLPRAQYVTRAAILAFLTERLAWPSYDPEQIHDPDLAAAARFERRRADGHWVRAVDWARARNYAPLYGGQLIRAGTVAGTKIGNVWYVWEEG